MLQVKLHDLNFYNDQSSSKFHNSKEFKWDRSGGAAKLVIFTDLCLPLAKMPIYKDSTKIAWLLEPYAINPNPYHYLCENWNNKDFKYILSHNNTWLKTLPNGVFIPNAMCWIKEKDFQLYPKTKLVSMIASNKRLTKEQTFRHDVATFAKSLLQHKLDLYGTGYHPIDDKIEALKDYQFSIAMENCCVDDYWSEKIIDCFKTGTVPIYYGSESIGRTFNKDGIIHFKTTDELDLILNEITMVGPAEYIRSHKMEKAIFDNFKLADHYLVAEDVIYKEVLVKNGLV